MSESFTEFLNKQKADADTIQQAARLYLSERTDDLSEQEMLSEVEVASGQLEVVAAAQKELENNLEVVQSILLTFLAESWQEHGEQEKIERAFSSAHQKLPLIEIAAITAVTIYSMYLLARLGSPEIGKKKEHRKVKRNTDGSFEEETTTEWHSASGPISAVGELFRGLFKGDGSE